MKNTKKSITSKIIIGVLLSGILLVTAFWVIYQRLNNYTQITQIKNENNEKLFLIGEAITGLYEAESLTRNIIQTSNIKKFELYKSKIDTILHTINEVSEMSGDTVQVQKIDSIKFLIDSKNKNFEELINIYKLRNEQGGVYKTAMEELEKIDDNFYDADLTRRWKNSQLPQHSQQYLKKLIEYSKEQNAKRLTSQTIDSLATSVRKVLADLEKKEKLYKREISDKENNLLKNDQIITKQLRDILAAIDRNERDKYFARLQASNRVLNETSNIILIIAAISLVIASIFLVLITKDISKSQQYRNELETEKNYTESLLKMRESIINTVTHDLRSPLNSVIGYSDLLERTGLNTKQKHYLGHLKKSSDYILHLVNDLLDLSRLEAGKMIIELLPFSPKKLIEDTVENVIPLDNPKNIDIKINIDDDLKKQYISDPFRIKQILTNLINNAYKFTDKGTITISCNLAENGLLKKELVVSVLDTGIGITEQQQHYIFKEFSQGDHSTEKKHGGFGLGLAITKKIIELLHGKITLQSKPNQGSKFTFYIPLGTADSTIHEEDTKSSVTPSFSNKKILIVDDDPSQLALTSEVASLAGLSYDISKNGAEAIALLQKNNYNLVLTDIQMPIMDGFELLKNAKKNHPSSSLPFIALSGRANINPREYINAGFSGSLRKPYAPKALLDLIAEVLEAPLKIDSISQNHIADSDEFSLEDLMLFADGDSQSLQAILDIFHNSTKDNLKELNTSITENDIKNIKRIAHKMLPMFKQIKAKEVTPIIEKLEHPERYNLNHAQVLSLTKEGIIKVNTLLEKLPSTSTSLH